ncbi:MAG: hypothetical protein IH971_08785 [Candidatus Marinimicrobia bacterium]|nr:hypothetical protein [Candidatus Neomarinimicrobiota bacterium]
MTGLALLVAVQPQSTTLSGFVRASSDHESRSYVNVIVAGTNVGAATNPVRHQIDGAHTPEPVGALAGRMTELGLRLFRGRQSVKLRSLNLDCAKYYQEGATHSRW